MTVTTTAPPVTRAKVGWGDLLWLTWRQHRWTVGGTAVVLGLGALTALVLSWIIDSTGTTEHELLFFGGFHGISQMIALVPAAVGAVIAVFWAAPLLSREHEQKTGVVVWSQDITATRWLLGKIVLLGVPAVALAAAFGSAALTLMHAVNTATWENYTPFMQFENEPFEAAPFVQAGYAAFGFGLGLAFSALTRRTVLSMGLTLGVYIVTRALVALAWRPYFQTPLRSLSPLTTDSYFSDRRDVLYVAGGYADAAGNEIEYPMVCARSFEAKGGFEKCLESQGVANRFMDYQPAERRVPFQLFEFGIFAVLAAGLLVLAYMWVRRSHKV